MCVCVCEVSLHFYDQRIFRLLGAAAVVAGRPSDLGYNGVMKINSSSNSRKRGNQAVKQGGSKIVCGFCVLLFAVLSLSLIIISLEKGETIVVAMHSAVLYAPVYLFLCCAVDYHHTVADATNSQLDSPFAFFHHYVIVIGMAVVSGYMWCLSDSNVPVYAMLYSTIVCEEEDGGLIIRAA